jgi:hypothetical protein
LITSAANGEVVSAIAVERARKNPLELPPPKGIKPRSVSEYDRSDQVAEQVCTLLHRLRDLSAENDPVALYAEFPDQLRHDLDQALDKAFRQHTLERIRELQQEVTQVVQDNQGVDGIDHTAANFALTIYIDGTPGAKKEIIERIIGIRLDDPRLSRTQKAQLKKALAVLTG